MKPVNVRDDEHDRLHASKRCGNCKHLWALHNAHCCSFCTIEGCECTCAEGDGGDLGADEAAE